jgi:sugar O-acyltransferase (sialic acid O-acetyltransferase NeuD family)
MSAHRNQPVVIFGDTPFASLACYCLTQDSPYRVAAFTVHQDWMREPTREGLPVAAFEALESHYPPEEFALLIAVGHRKINGLRAACYDDGKRRGYRFVSYVSSRASVWPNVAIGENCMVFDHAILQPFASIGNNVIVRSGAHVSHHCDIADHVFLAAEVAIGGETRVGERAFLGVGAILRDRLRVAPRTFVGAGAVVLADTEADAVYIGNPARKRKLIQAASVS